MSRPRQTCHWCGARESGLGVHSDPDQAPKFSCSQISKSGARLCPHRPEVIRPKTRFYAMIEDYALRSLEGFAALRAERQADLAFACGTQWPTRGVKLGDTIQIRRPSMFAAE